MKMTKNIIHDIGQAPSSLQLGPAVNKQILDKFISNFISLSMFTYITIKPKSLCIRNRKKLTFIKGWKVNLRYWSLARSWINYFLGNWKRCRSNCQYTRISTCVSDGWKRVSSIYRPAKWYLQITTLLSVKWRN